MDKLGFICWHNGVCDRNITAVKDAATSAELDNSIVRDIRPRSAFIRAANSLVKAGILQKGNKGILKDKISEEDDNVIFQFSTRQISGEEAVYSAQAVISFDKITEKITVSAPNLSLDNLSKLKETVYKLFEQKGFTYSHIDFHALLNKIFNKAARRILMRDGVYFISSDNEDLIKQVRVFYNKLGFSFSCVTVHSDDTVSKHDIYQAVIDDIKKNMQGLQDELKEIELESAQAKTQEEKAKAGISRTVGKNRFEQVKADYEKYGKIAESLRDNLQSYIQDAGDYGKILAVMVEGPESMIAAMQGGNIDPVFEILSKKALESQNTEEKVKKFKLEPGQVLQVMVDNELITLNTDNLDIPQID